jgi:hypothetical protein
MKGLRILACLALFSSLVEARADYLFTWHNIYPFLPQQFHGSFEVTDAEMQPGAAWGTDLFRHSIAITDPNGITYNAEPSWSSVGGNAGPSYLINFILHDPSHTMSMTVVATGEGIAPISGGVTEFFPSGNPSPLSESGYWTFQQVPEPSIIGLLSLGALGWFTCRKQRSPS